MSRSTDALPPSGRDCLAFTARRTARAVTNYLNILLRPFELNVAQFGLIKAIQRMPGCTLREIGEDLILDESTVTRNLTVLERRKLVESEGGRGRSGKRLSITQEGEALILDATVAWRRGNRELLARLSEPEVIAGRNFLEALASAAGSLKADEASHRELAESEADIA